MPLSSDSDFPNSKFNEICERCSRRFSYTNSNRSSPESFKFYGKLCENSKCRIHRKGLTKKKFNLKRKNNYRKSWKSRSESSGKSYRINIPDAPCEVEEFEDGAKTDDEDIDPKLYSKIETMVANFDLSKEIKLTDIVGHGLLKEVIHRTIIWPLKNPEIFKGLRNAPKGVLLFGPPGTGKALIGQSIAFETKSTFFNVSSSSLTSKSMGESEKLVRTMFIVAKARQPSIIFIDEIDNLFSQKIKDDCDSSRRMKNELFVYMASRETQGLSDWSRVYNKLTIQQDGIETLSEDKIMVIGATSRPQELDEAARRRFFKRLYVPLPDESARKALLAQLLQCECHSLKESDLNEIVKKTEGYSALDLKNLSQEAAMGPIKSLSTSVIIHLKPHKIRPISYEDFSAALGLIKPSVSEQEVKTYEQWDFLYGYGNNYHKKVSVNPFFGQHRGPDNHNNNSYII